MSTLSNIESYGSSFQLKVISSLLTYKKFLINVHDIIEVDNFENPSVKWIIKTILQYYDKFHTVPDLDTLKIELKKIDNEVLQIAIKEKLKEAYVASTEDLQYVQDEFTLFCKNQQLKKALLSSANLLETGDFDGIRLLVDNALKAGMDKNIGHEYILDIESRYRENVRNPIPTPWSIFNELLQGGLGGGDFGLFFGNPGGGKSWTLVALGGYAVKLGYNVNHYTLELGEDYVGRRYDAYFTNIEAKDISGYKSEVEDLSPQLPGNLIIKEFPTKRATILTIEAHLQKCKDMGQEPDLIIIDYADLLKSTRKGTYDDKADVDDVYMDIKGLAKELNKPIWSVSQVNREGAKEDVIEGTHASKSYDKIFITDFCASLSRKKEDKVAGTGRFHIMKNRYGDDGMTYNAKINTGTGHFEIDGVIEEENNEKLLPIPQNVGKNPPSISPSNRNKLRDKFFELDME